MKAYYIQLLLLVACASSTVITRNKRDSKLSEKDIEELDDVYGFIPSVSGVFKIALTWTSNKLISESPEATTELLVLNSQCSAWAKINQDRLFQWHEGKATVYMIDEQGHLTSKCLGSTLKDPDCSYFVAIPINWITSIMPEKYAILTVVVMRTSFQTDGIIVGFQEMMDQYPQHECVIERSRPCYPE